jgi:hypothetical protein
LSPDERDHHEVSLLINEEKIGKKKAQNKNLHWKVAQVLFI